MSDYRFSFPACVIAGKGRIAADDLLMLRTYTFPAGIRSREDAELVFALNRICPEHCGEWRTYFVETLADFVVYAETPRGFMGEAKSIWLQQMVSENGGVVQNALELELLLHAMELVACVPENLSVFALDQVRFALSPLPDGIYRTLRPDWTGITPYDLAYLWRVLRGSLVNGQLRLSPLEFLVLGEIDRSAPATAHHTAWHDLMASVITVEKRDMPLRDGPWLRLVEPETLGNGAAA